MYLIHGQRTRRERHVPGFRSLLHDETGRKRNGSGPEHLLRNHHGTWGDHSRQEYPDPWRVVYHRVASSARGSSNLYGGHEGHLREGWTKPPPGSPWFPSGSFRDPSSSAHSSPTDATNTSRTPRPPLKKDLYP